MFSHSTAATELYVFSYSEISLKSTLMQLLVWLLELGNHCHKGAMDSHRDPDFSFPAHAPNQWPKDPPSLCAETFSRLKGCS